MNTLILGRRGLGKSTLAVWRGRQLSKHIIAWSPSAQFSMADYRTTNWEDLIDFIDGANDDEEYLAEYIPQDDLEADFNFVGEKLWEYGGYALVVDEANELQSPSKINDVLSRFIRRAPRREKGDDESEIIDIIQTTHFPVDLHKVSFGLGDEAYIFRLTRLRDKIRIEDELGPEIAAAVDSARTPETHPPGRDVVYANIVNREFHVMENPEEWNIRLRRETPEPIHE